jgi:hypothetical protein
VATRPLTMLLKIMPNIRGNMENPLSVALTPNTNCMYSGMNMMTPKKAMLRMNPATFVIANARLRSEGSMMDRSALNQKENE